MSSEPEDIIESVQGVADFNDNLVYVRIGLDGVESIRREEENLSDYRIAWYRAYNADGRVLSQVNARRVELVVYVKQPKPD